jgi:hypothetical protein
MGGLGTLSQIVGLSGQVGKDLPFRLLQAGLFRQVR